MSTSLTTACGLVGFSILNRSVGNVDSLRRSPGPGTGEPLSIGTLKHIDEQTLLVLEAIGALQQKLTISDLTNWTVVAAPRFLGRAILVPTISKFLSEGAWGVSPHIVPHRSLHSISGTISQVYKIHGPNFGVGGGPGHVGEGILAALPLVQKDSAPGVILAISRIEPELIPDRMGRLHPDEIVQCVILALTPDGAFPAPHRIEIHSEPSRAESNLTFPRLIQLLEATASSNVIVESLVPGLQLRIVRSPSSTPVPVGFHVPERSLHRCP